MSDAAGSAILHGGELIGTVPALLRRVLEEQAWRLFITQRDEEVHHEWFADL